MSSSRSEAEALDAADPLAAFRERFVIPDPDRIYLDGNSLGRLSIDAREAIEATTADWAARAVEAWADWIELPVRIGDQIAATVIGAQPGEVLVADSVTVNLYKLAHAAADERGGPIVTDAGNFPTDRYVLEAVARQRDREYVEAPTVEEAMERAAGGVLCLSHVDYRSGRLLDMAEVTAATDAHPDLGSQPLGRRRGDRPCGRGAGGWMHVQVPQRRSRSAWLPLRPARPPGNLAVAHPGLVRPA